MNTALSVLCVRFYSKELETHKKLHKSQQIAQCYSELLAIESISLSFFLLL